MGPETVSVENPYGLAALWAQGDFVAKGTLILLALMSAYSWFIIFTKWWEQRRLLRQAREVEKAFWSAENIKAGVNKLSGKGNIFKGIAAEAIDAAEHHDERLTQQVPLHEWIDNVMARSVGRINNGLATQLPFLATTGSTAPFIGLFGTVWGIYHALVAIGIAGQASIDKVAGPVGEALIMTAIGLAVAVPAVLGYNYLLGRNKMIMERVRLFSNDLEQVIVSGSRVEGTGAKVIAGTIGSGTAMAPGRSASETTVPLAGARDVDCSSRHWASASCDCTRAICAFTFAISSCSPSGVFAASFSRTCPSVAVAAASCAFRLNTSFWACS